jgi:hypothetical protein
MINVVCIIHDNHLTIERNGEVIGNIYEIDGEPIIKLKNSLPTIGFVSLTFTDLDIISENWQQMKEMQLTSTNDPV